VFLVATVGLVILEVELTEGWHLIHILELLGVMGFLYLLWAAWRARPDGSESRTRAGR
jgi:threonine/homoserine/homoserine lactone efflux protein